MSGVLKEVFGYFVGAMLVVGVFRLAGCPHNPDRGYWREVVSVTLFLCVVEVIIWGLKRLWRRDV